MNEEDNGGKVEKVKGKAFESANFKDFKNPDGAGDDEMFDINKSGVKFPTDSEKKLPQQGGRQ